MPVYRNLGDQRLMCKHTRQPFTGQLIVNIQFPRDDKNYRRSDGKFGDEKLLRPFLLQPAAKH